MILRTFKVFAHFEVGHSDVAKASGWTSIELQELKRICAAVRHTVYGKGKITVTGPMMPVTITELDTGFFSLSVGRYLVTEPSLQDLANSVEISLPYMVKPLSAGK